MTISGRRTEQLDIFCFTSDFLNFIVVEHIRFFHGALQLIAKPASGQACKIISTKHNAMCTISASDK